MKMIMPALYIVLAPITVYLYHLIKRALSLTKLSHHRAIALSVTGLWLVSLYFIISSMNYPIIMAILYFCGFSLIIELVNFIIKKLRRSEGTAMKGPWRFLYKSSVLPLVLTLALMGYGLWNGHTYTMTSYSVTTDKTLSEPLRIALISDLHLGGNMDAEGFADVLYSVQISGPDVLVLDGDLFDESTLRSEMEKACGYLKDFKSTYGTYFVMGNHDQRHYKDMMGSTGDDSEDFDGDYMEYCLVTAGVTVLHDEAVQLTDGVVLIGRRDYSESGRATVEELMADVSAGSYVIMLDHQPRETEDKAAAGVDLVLSGHTHAGQVWPLNILNDTVFSNDYNYGLHAEGDTTTIVSSGIGCWAYPMRTAGNCEWVRIDITAGE